MLIPPEIKDSVPGANGENTSSNGPDNEHDISQESPSNLTRRATRTILVRDSLARLHVLGAHNRIYRRDLLV